MIKPFISHCGKSSSTFFLLLNFVHIVISRYAKCDLHESVKLLSQISMRSFPRADLSRIFAFFLAYSSSLLHFRFFLPVVLPCHEFSFFLRPSPPHSGFRGPASSSDFPPVFHFISRFRHFRPLVFTYY